MKPLRGHLFILLALLVLPLVGSAQAEANIVILTENIASDDSGLIRFDMIARDENGFGLVELLPGNLEIGEPSRDLTISTAPRLDIALAVIVDLNIGSDARLIQNTLRAYFETYYQDGDQVTFYILDTQTYTPRVVDITSLDDALTLIDGLNQSGRFYLLPQVLETALAQMQALGDIPSRPRHVLYVTSYMTAPSDAQLSAPFAEAGVPFHAVQAHRTRDTAPVRAFAENGGGLYVNNVDGAQVLEGDTPINRLKVLYDLIDASRNVFTVEYQSLNTQLVERRTVPITFIPSADVRVTADISYDWNFQPLEVQFTDADDLVASRTPLRPNNDNTLVFEGRVQPVEVRVTFPDGVERDLESVRLQVTREGSGEVQQSIVQRNPILTERNTITLDWLLDEYTTPDAIIPVQLTVTVEDELGLRVSQTADGRVEIGAAPPLVEPDATPTEVVGATPTPTDAPVAVVAVGENGEPILVNGEPLVLTPTEGFSTQTISYFILVIGVLVLALVFLLMRLLSVSQRAPAAATNTVPGAAPAATLPPAPSPVTDDAVAEPYVYDEEDFSTQHEVEQQDAAPADETILRLVVRQGYEQMKNLDSRLIRVESLPFTIGRAESNDWRIALPIISPQHCQITMSDDGQVMVRDMDSKNGTFVNGERAPEGLEMLMPVGSELGITQGVIVGVYDNKMVIEDENLELDQKQSVTRTVDDLQFKTLPGIDADEIDVDAVIDDDYTPI